MTDYKSILLYYYKGNTNTQIAIIAVVRVQLSSRQ